MKKLFFAAFALCAFSVTVRAQDARANATPFDQEAVARAAVLGAEIETNDLEKKVQLTSDQRARIMEANRSIGEKQAYLKATGQDTEQNMKDLENARQKMYFTILTDAQVVQYKQAIDKKRKSE